MNFRLFQAFVLALPALLGPGVALAWGPIGHAVIGQAAVQGADMEAQAAVAEILGAESPAALMDAIDTACNWPDAVRETGEWSWSAPLHYVNMPHGIARYDRQRDCPDGLCVTEGILRFAAELGRPELDGSDPDEVAGDPPRRWRAFAWLCHLVGDLHQPLHAGVRDDRGGNLVNVRYRGETYNLHEFWDEVLAAERCDAECRAAAARAVPAAEIPRWGPADVAAWTGESHALAFSLAYPPGFTSGMEIDDGFADRSWSLTREQWRSAAARLAAILNAVLGSEGAAEAGG